MNLATDVAYVPIYNAEYLGAVKDGVTFHDYDGMWYMRRWVNEVTDSSSSAAQR